MTSSTMGIAARMWHSWRPLVGVCLAGALAGCAVPTVVSDDQSALQHWSPVATGSQGWAAQTLPGKEPTRYDAVRRDGQWRLHAQARASASMLRRQMAIDAQQIRRLRYSWQVASLISGADLTARDKEDSPVRVVLAFDGDHSQLSLKNQSMFDLAQLLTGERPPYATLMYVWENRARPESVIINPRTDRIRKIVAESGSARVGQWLSYERDVVADFRRAFGEEPGRLIGVAVMTDSDNTRSDIDAWYGDVALLSVTGERL